VRNGAEVCSKALDGYQVDWCTEDDGDEASDYYYVRLIRQDGEMAWSSPVWVDAI